MQRTAPGSAVVWTLHWPESDSRLGYNVKVKADAVESRIIR